MLDPAILAVGLQRNAEIRQAGSMRNQLLGYRCHSTRSRGMHRGRNHAVRGCQQLSLPHMVADRHLQLGHITHMLA
ncbi:hypothetical protein GALL_312460 [mine drainage metagenome]|uniref:Uncharacterized protein n=1 Tax=mine drainage metagenome TaxID=410659 RepID=A0A1J5QUD4_9ZZZZ